MKERFYMNTTSVTTFYFENTSNLGFELLTSRKFPLPTKIVFSGDYTHVFWEDDSKTSVKLMVGDPYDEEHAVASAIAHKLFGSKTKFRKFVESGYHQLVKVKNKVEDDFPF